MMLAVSIASFCFIMAATVGGMPISGTHTVVSSLVGAGIVGCGASEVNWMKVLKIVASWVISPFLTCSMCILFICLACATTLGGFNFSLRARLISMSLMTGMAFALINYMMLTLF